MRYPFAASPLYVTQQRIHAHGQLLRGSRWLILQHLVDDTNLLISHLLEAGVTIDAIIGKAYSTDPIVKRRLEKSNIPVLSIEQLETADYLKLLKKSIAEAHAHRQRIIVTDIGGFFSEALAQLSLQEKRAIAGVIEDTTYGLHRYQDAKLPLPVFQVATGPLKLLESVFVGRSIVTVLEQTLHDQGHALIGAQVLVIGYGLISRAIAFALRRVGITPSVSEINSIRALQAYSEGYPLLYAGESLQPFDIILSATGTQVITPEDVVQLKDGVILASGGSQDVEFGINQLKLKASRRRSIGSDLVEYRIEGRRVRVLCDGYPINFKQKSVPVEVIDIMFAEIIESAASLLKSKRKPAGIYEITESNRKQLAEAWLDHKR